MQPGTRIYYSIVYLIVQHVSRDTPLIIRSSKTVIAASGFTCVPFIVKYVTHLDIVLFGYSEISAEKERGTGVDNIRLQNWFVHL